MYVYIYIERESSLPLHIQLCMYDIYIYIYIRSYIYLYIYRERESYVYETSVHSSYTNRELYIAITYRAMHSQVTNIRRILCTCTIFRGQQSAHDGTVFYQLSDYILKGFGQVSDDALFPDKINILVGQMLQHKHKLIFAHYYLFTLVVTFLARFCPST